MARCGRGVIAAMVLWLLAVWVAAAVHRSGQTFNTGAKSTGHDMPLLAAQPGAR